MELLKSTFVWVRYLGIVLGGYILLKQIASSKISLVAFVSTPHGLFNMLVSWFIVLVALSIQIFVWILLYDSIGIALPKFKAFLGFSLSFLPRYIPGTVWGYFSRNEWLFNEFNINRRISFLTTIIELVVIFLSLFCFIGLTLLPPSLIVYVGYLSLFLGLEYLLIIIVVNAYASEKLTKHPVEQSISLSSFLKIFFLSLSSWFFYGLSMYFLTGDYSKISTWHHSIQQVIQYSSSFAIAWFGGFLVFFIPSGIGIRESILAKLIQTSATYNVQESLSFSIMFRVVISFGEIALILCGLMYKLIKFRRISGALKDD